ncbi:hypothetical protein MTsDn5_20330 [Alteromonas gracilis]
MIIVIDKVFAAKYWSNQVFSPQSLSGGFGREPAASCVIQWYWLHELERGVGKRKGNANVFTVKLSRINSEVEVRQRREARVAGIAD